MNGQVSFSATWILGREIVNVAPDQLQPDVAALYSKMGRLSIAPAKLVRAMLCQAFYSIRIEETFGWIKTIAGQDKTVLT